MRHFNIEVIGTFRSGKTEFIHSVRTNHNGRWFENQTRRELIGQLPASGEVRYSNEVFFRLNAYHPISSHVQSVHSLYRLLRIVATHGQIVFINQNELQRIAITTNLWDEGSLGKRFAVPTLVAVTNKESVSREDLLAIRNTLNIPETVPVMPYNPVVEPSARVLLDTFWHFHAASLSKNNVIDAPISKTRSDKVVILGARGSGKSIFVDLPTETEVTSTAPRPDPVERQKQIDAGTAIDYGRITLSDAHAFYLFGMPVNFDEHSYSSRQVTYEDMGEGALGAILLVNSTNPTTFDVGKEMLAYYHSMHPTQPYLIAATHQDMDGALTPEQVRAAIGVPDEIPVVGCNATDRASVENVLVTFLKHYRSSGARGR